jgi:putative restriction endonuclease
MRQAAFAAVNRLAAMQGELTAADLKAGFQFQGIRVPLINPQRGIFKPRQMKHLLSIRTVFPMAGARVWYDDQRDVHRQIYQGDEHIEYAFMGSNPDAADNRWLREAMADRIPIIYFLGVAPGLYMAITPAYIVGWDAGQLKAYISFSPSEDLKGSDYPTSSIERRYALRQVKHRLHQASFREACSRPIKRRCAVSGLPEVRLLDAAHI